MTGRKAEARRVPCDVVDAQRLRTIDQQTEDAAPARQARDRGTGLLVDTRRDELREAAATAVQDAERRVPRAGQVAGSGEDLVEDGGQIESRRQRAADLQQPLETIGTVALGCAARDNDGVSIGLSPWEQSRSCWPTTTRSSVPPSRCC